MYSNVEPPAVATFGKTFLEAPLYDDAAGLYFAENRFGGVRLLQNDGQTATVVAHRKGIGGFALHADGGYIVSGRNVAYKTREGETVVLIADGPGRVGFNDMVTDETGRVYAGSLAEPGWMEGPERAPGELYLIELDGSARVVADGIRLANGIGIAPDGTRLYMSDSGEPAVVHAFERDPATGDVGKRSVLCEFAVGDGRPDGLAVAQDGSIWVAIVGGGRVARYSPEGRELGGLRIPVPLVTSVCFGGPDGQTLFVVTGTEGDADGVDAAVYAVHVGIRGVEIPQARIDVKREPATIGITP